MNCITLYSYNPDAILSDLSESDQKITLSRIDEYYGKQITLEENKPSNYCIAWFKTGNFILDSNSNFSLDVQYYEKAKSLTISEFLLSFLNVIAFITSLGLIPLVTDSYCEYDSILLYKNTKVYNFPDRYSIRHIIGIFPAIFSLFISKTDNDRFLQQFSQKNRRQIIREINRYEDK